MSADTTPGPGRTGAEETDPADAGDRPDSGAAGLMARAAGLARRIDGFVGRVDGSLRRRAHPLGLGATVVLAACAYAVLGLVKLATFRASIFDLVIFDQAVRGYAGLGPPTAPAVGVNYGLGMDFLQLADHFSPILAVLAPLYWIHDGPQTLIVAQAVLLALAAVPVWHYAARRLGPVPAHLVAVAYAVSWPVAQTAGFDFHEVAFVPLLSAIMIERFDAGRRGVAVLAALGLLLVKEDMGLLVAGFGVYLLVTRRRLEGTAFVLLALAALVTIRGVLMPLAGAGEAGFHWAYGRWGATVGEAAAGLARDPLGALWQFVSPEIKVDTLAFLFWPVLLTALFSPLTLMAVPMIAERFLGDRPQWWGPDHHYNAFIVAALLCAGVDGADRLGRRLRNRHAGREAGRYWAVGVCVIAITLIPRFALGNLVEWSFYEGDPHVAAAREAVSAVPDGVVVEAVNHVGPALTSRTTVLLWGPVPRDAPWIVADVDRWSFPFGAHELQRQRVDEALRSGYRPVFERDGYIVLNRPS
ncbi:DUF2079 domain-containing protein [Planomonospora parontospora]|uniref:DUF2079 domain-containing protein n=1 Tax=Planomonospora parontospora TaxID=58119 RepID=UPI0019B71734|nr:DUF2079 domain-containing protein [Planomonospora parontospora]GGL06884.1 hypothetical protein GCM10014719_06250 [Planomonospora parontospora subsp. antibiotica]GII14159.1 hypothetical protein Ppa05_08850 [Planomonospora parontospora subsp. antibiotica]